MLTSAAVGQLEDDELSLSLPWLAGGWLAWAGVSPWPRDVDGPVFRYDHVMWVWVDGIVRSVC